MSSQWSKNEIGQIRGPEIGGNKKLKGPDLSRACTNRCANRSATQTGHEFTAVISSHFGRVGTARWRAGGPPSEKQHLFKQSCWIQFYE